MTTADELITKAISLRAQGHMDQAAQAYSDAIEQDEQNLGAHLGLARLALELSQLEEVEVLLNRCDALVADNPQVLVLRGLLLESQKQLEPALEVYRKAVLLDSLDYEARYQLGRAMVVAGQYPAGVEQLQQAVRIDDTAVDPHYVLGTAFVKMGQLGDAVSSLTNSLELNPEFLDGYVTLADVLSMANEFDAAKDVLRQAQQRFPSTGALFDKLAALELKQGDLQAATEAIKNQISVESDNEASYVNLVATALGVGDIETAAWATDTLLAKNPDSWQGHYILSMILDAADRLDDAIAACRKAHQLSPEQWSPLNDLGYYLNAKSQQDPTCAREAVDVLTTASRLAPPSELAPQFNLALAYWNAKKPKDSLKTARAIVKAGSPGDQLVQQAEQLVQAIKAAT